MKKLLVLAAVAAMAMGAKADYTYTLDLPGAQAVYRVAAYIADDNADRSVAETAWAIQLSPIVLPENPTYGEDWDAHYTMLSSMFSSWKFSGSEGSFSTFHDGEVPLENWFVLVLEGEDSIVPSAKYACYYGETGDKDVITLDLNPIASGYLMPGEPAPVPEPTSGLLLLLGVAGLALKRKRA